MLHWWRTVAMYQAVAHALRLTKGNRSQAAKVLGITRTYLLRLISHE